MKCYVLSLLFFGLAGIAITLSACNSPMTLPEAEDHLYGNFKTVVATAPEDGYRPYWLGRGFDAGGLRFKGPFTADFAEEVEGGVSTDYVADNSGVLNLTSYSPPAWERAEARGTPFGSAMRPVTVAGRPAVLTTVTERGSVGQLRLDLEIDHTHVRAIAQAVVMLTPGPNQNPLVDERTFLEVLSHLRPYPQ
jgi:hypothetical protein